MDDIQFFGNQSINESEDLPWGKQWINTTSDPKRILEVITVYSGDKGLLILTGEFKLFFFKKQLIAKQLLEALQVWSVQDNPVFPLIACYVNNKPQCGINKSGKLVYWHQDESKYYSTRIEEPLTRTELVNLTNPFLTQTIPPKDEEEKPKTPKERSRKNSPISTTQEGQEPT